ncbi:hypothetical protein MU516_11560 [Paracoccus sp. YLB-12]|uniref:Uncharacterized protein n=1 Tax=Paracoccus maritimus TaxID=2933292 RepID=A0ABT2KCC4_9RHOB|nr:hypothetical protein [Paracoccus sp. YLB-12]MCT4333500.1 hypothetical protein [Paracoccus sp. YLB-12]
MTRPWIQAATVCLLASGPTLASTDEAWEEFRASVEEACSDLVQSSDGALVSLDMAPFGSESYGAALLSIKPSGGEAERVICIYDKKTRTAELTGSF